MDVSAAEARFRLLFGQHYPAVLAYAMRRARAEDARDIAAETFTVAWRRIGDVPVGAELPWLYGVARRVLANQQRSERRRSRLTARLGADARSRAVSDTGGADLETVLAALRRLRPADREILRLAAWEGLTPAALAVTLGCSANAAAIRLHRARRRLEKEMEGGGHDRMKPLPDHVTGRDHRKATSG